MAKIPYISTLITIRGALHCLVTPIPRICWEKMTETLLTLESKGSNVHFIVLLCLLLTLLLLLLFLWLLCCKLCNGGYSAIIDLNQYNPMNNNTHIRTKLHCNFLKFERRQLGILHSISLKNVINHSQGWSCRSSYQNSWIYPQPTEWLNHIT